MRPETTTFGKITQNKGHFAVHFHSRSPILVPIRSSYTNSYQWLILTSSLSSSSQFLKWPKWQSYCYGPLRCRRRIHIVYRLGLSDNRYDRENKNVLRRCLKTANDGAAVTWAGRSFHTAAPEAVNVRLPTGSTNDRYVQAITAGGTQSSWSTACLRHEWSRMEVTRSSAVNGSIC